MISLKRISLTVFLLMLTLASVAHAKVLEDGKNDRKGFLLGFGVGGGGTNLTVPGYKTTRGAFLADLKIGAGLTENLLLMYNGSVVYTKINGVNVEILNMPVAVQWFFKDNFYVRPGVGLSIAQLSTTSGGTTISRTSSTSFGADLAGGYEFRLGKAFTLSPEAVYHYSHISSNFTGSGNANSFGAQASLLWYF